MCPKRQTVIGFISWQTQAFGRSRKAEQNAKDYGKHRELQRARQATKAGADYARKASAGYYERNKKAVLERARARWEEKKDERNKRRRELKQASRAGKVLPRLKRGRAAGP